MTIIVGIDGSDAGRHAAEWAINEARRRHEAVRLVHGWTYAIGGHAATARTLVLLASASQSLLDRTVAEARASAPDVDVDGLLVSHLPARALLEAAREPDVTMLVVGSRGQGELSALFVGSVADACAQHATVPVVIVRPEAVEHADGPIVVGVDGSASSIAALAWARDEAAARGVPVLALHAWSEPYATELAVMAGISDDSRAAEAAAVLECSLAGDDTSQGQVVRDIAPAALIDASRTATMLVVGSRGRGGFVGLLLGSVSRRCIHAAECPVVVVRAEPPADR